MNVLIDIGHPAHVHLFKHFAWEMLKDGNKVLFTCREKEFEIELLKYYGFEFISFGKKYSSTIGKLAGMLEFDAKEFIVGLKYKPDVLLSHGSIYAAHAAFLLRKPHISFEDTFNFEQIRLYAPFTSAILTADYANPLNASKVVRYSGYHELAYLHPNRFPHKLDIDGSFTPPSGRYALLRFVSWNASHDSGHTGISVENKILIAEELSKYAKVYISSEKPLPPVLEKYKIQVPPQYIHHFMSGADLIFGESATMVSEGAVLGVPGIYIDNTSRLYTQEQEKNYGMVFNYSESETDQKLALAKAIELLRDSDLKRKWSTKRNQLLQDKIDVTSFLMWFVKNFPTSMAKVKADSKYQQQFK